MIIIVIFGCESKYEKAFEEIDKREIYASPIKGEESLEEIELLTNAIEFKPELSALYFYRAEQFELFGEYEKAIKDYQTCIEQDWVFGNLFYQKGICELKLKNYETANVDFQMAKRLIEEEWEEWPEEEKEPNHWGNPRLEHQDMLKELEERMSFTKSRIK